METIQHLANDVRMACQQVSRRVRFESDAELAPHHASVLFKLLDGPRTPGELADAERIAPPSMTKTVNCLAERGLVATRDNPADGRSKLVALTDAGRALLDATVRARDDWMVRKLQGLSDDELTVLRGATELLNRVLEK
ncbi:MAG: MarR family transcriptional regulator [Propionibacteriaceae bacterium]|nr:MarR family transcriptional regulator [Propionibacteriaceae bacterium]